METLGEKIRRLREERGFTQAEVADACSVSRVAVTKWESGDTENIKLGNLQRLSQKLQIDVLDLLGWKRPSGDYRFVAEDAKKYAAERTGKSADDLSDDERHLLDLYRRALPQMRSAILASAAALAEQAGKPDVKRQRRK